LIDVYDALLGHVAAMFNVPAEQLGRRTAEAVNVRFVVQTALVDEGMSAAGVGRMADKDHTSVLNACARIRKRIAAGDAELARALAAARLAARALIGDGGRGIPGAMSALIPLREKLAPFTDDAVPTGKPANVTYTENPTLFVPRVVSFWVEYTDASGAVVAGGSCKVTWYSIVLTDQDWRAVLIEEVTATAGTLYTRTINSPGHLYARMHTFTAPGATEDRIKLYARVG